MTFWVLAIVVPTLVMFNPELSRVLSTPSFSRWFVGIPIALLTAYGTLRVNYERFGRLESQVLAQQTALDRSDLPYFQSAGSRGSWLYSDPMTAVATSAPIQRVPEMFVLSIHLKNVPLRRSQRSAATDVSAALDFFTPDRPTKPVLENVIGQWITESSAPLHVGAKATGPSIDIPPNDIPARLYVALKPRRADEAFAYSKENLHAYRDGSHPSFALPHTEYRVRVRLACNESEQILWFQLKTDGTNQEPLQIHQVRV